MSRRMPAKVHQALLQVLRSLGILDPLADREKALASALSKTVRPLLIPDERGNLTIVGSCVLVCFGRRFFMFTAAHVLDEAKEHTLYLEGPSNYINLAETMMHQTDLQDSMLRRDDKFDIGFMELHPDKVAQLRGLHFITSQEIDPNDIAGDQAFYFALGYPAKIAKIDRRTKSVQSRPMSLTSMADQRVYADLGVTPSTHLAVRFDREAVSSGERQQAAPKPYGMSGGGLWRFESIQSPSAITSTDKLVGILIEWHDSSKKVMVAARISLFLEVLRSAFPELDAEIPRCTTIKLKTDYLEQ